MIFWLASSPEKTFLISLILGCNDDWITLTSSCHLSAIWFRGKIMTLSMHARKRIEKPGFPVMLKSQTKIHSIKKHNCLSQSHSAEYIRSRSFESNWVNCLVFKGPKYNLNLWNPSNDIEEITNFELEVSISLIDNFWFGDEMRNDQNLVLAPIHAPESIFISLKLVRFSVPWSSTLTNQVPL